MFLYIIHVCLSVSSHYFCLLWNNFFFNIKYFLLSYSINVVSTFYQYIHIVCVDFSMDSTFDNPDNKVHGANMGSTWVLSAPDGPHVGLMNLAIWIIQPIGMFISIASGHFNRLLITHGQCLTATVSIRCWKLVIGSNNSVGDLPVDSDIYLHQLNISLMFINFLCNFNN